MNQWMTLIYEMLGKSLNSGPHFPYTENKNNTSVFLIKYEEKLKNKYRAFNTVSSTYNFPKC